MSVILLFQEAAQLNISLWGLGLTGLTIVVTIFFGAHKIIMSGKKQTDEKIHGVKTTLKQDIEKLDTKKVDMRLFEQTCTAIEDKIDINDRNIDQRLSAMDKKIDKIDGNIDTLINLHLNKDK